MPFFEARAGLKGLQMKQNMTKSAHAVQGEERQVLVSIFEAQDHTAAITCTRKCRVRVVK
jgi:hypothetical protein